MTIQMCTNFKYKDCLGFSRENEHTEKKKVLVGNSQMTLGMGLTWPLPSCPEPCLGHSGNCLGSTFRWGPGLGPNTHTNKSRFLLFLILGALSLPVSSVKPPNCLWAEKGIQWPGQLIGSSVLWSSWSLTQGFLNKGKVGLWGDILRTPEWSARAKEDP